MNWYHEMPWWATGFFYAGVLTVICWVWKIIAGFASFNRYAMEDDE